MIGDEDMAPLAFDFRKLNKRSIFVRKTDSSGLDSVLPLDNPQKFKNGTSYIEDAFSIEAVTDIKIPPDDIGGKRALRAYGTESQTPYASCSELVDFISNSLEERSYQGKRLRTGLVIRDFEDHPSGIKFTFLAMPYFLLQRLQQRGVSSSSKSHWVQPLVQSAYHLDSSVAREDQQAIRNLYDGNIHEALHVPRLWILTMGHKFIATCSPTALYNAKTSYITTSMIGKAASPSMIRLIWGSGFFFCLSRTKCEVWFKFIHQVSYTLSEAFNGSISVGNLVYRLQSDGSRIEGHNWESVLQSHPGDEPLCILVQPEDPESLELAPLAIALEGDYSGEFSDNFEGTRLNVKILSSQTMDAYGLPFQWGPFRSGAGKDLIIPYKLTDLDQKILCDHTRRFRAKETRFNASRVVPYNDESPHYVPPEQVLEAVECAVEVESAHTHHSEFHVAKEEVDGQPSAGRTTQPILRWPIKQEICNANPMKDVLNRRDLKPSTARKSLGQPERTSVHGLASSHQMKALAAHMHYELLFVPSRKIAKFYNDLCQKTKADIETELVGLLNNHHVNTHIFKLASSFFHHVSGIVGCFIDEDYDCLVKRKLCAAILLVVHSFRIPFSDPLFSFHYDILSLPLLKVKNMIQALQNGIPSTECRYITRSMASAFSRILVLVIQISSQASKLTEAYEHSKTSKCHNSHIGTSSSSKLKGSKLAPDETDNMSDAASSDEEINLTKTTAAPKNTAGPDFQEADFLNDVKISINRILSDLHQAQHECGAILCSEDGIEQGYGIIDSGQIIALVMKSIIQGHSTSNQMRTLDVVDIYATRTTQLQLEARNKPRKSLLIEMNLLKEELVIITDNIRDQLGLMDVLLGNESVGNGSVGYDSIKYDSDGSESDDDSHYFGNQSLFHSLYAVNQGKHSVVDKAISKILNNMQTDLQDKVALCDELTQRVALLERQVVQRVDIMQEDHGKAILIFTIVSAIFLPLSFVTSYLGMNTSDIRDMELSQALFWQVAMPFTVVIVSLVLIGTYNADRIVGWLSRGSRLP
ncbi:hypothetical protein N7508_000570 [Penicillium antarcticum]|uniref:uncharacterized protein n=1 Tax=Penicillium antarcticum TaxID=416450 RepID=UPI00239620B5|nr:uncharacterized protein N7508_000570 [Penicillium antarcticum]KAJ5320287.1 hypothetical protein N7508_000570 [Penicillium antarcticum]